MHFLVNLTKSFFYAVGENANNNTPIEETFNSVYANMPRPGKWTSQLNKGRTLGHGRDVMS